MDEYIVEEVMKLAGIYGYEEAYLPHIVLYINGVFSSLNQLGAGPPEGFSISMDSLPQWSEFTDDPVLLGFVKEYVVAKVMKRFNPPANGTLMASLKETIEESESRIIYRTEEVKNQNG